MSLLAIMKNIGTKEDRQVVYRALFASHILEQAITDIREATKKAWVLGNDLFKQRIQAQLSRRVEQKAKGVQREK